MRRTGVLVLLTQLAYDWVFHLFTFFHFHSCFEQSMMLIKIVTAWCHHQKDRPLWSTDRAHRLWALDSWHTRTHGNAWCSFFSLRPLCCFFWFFFENSSQNILVYEARIARGIDTEALLLCLSYSITPTDSTSFFRGTASETWISTLHVFMYVSWYTADKTMISTLCSKVGRRIRQIEGE